MNKTEKAKESRKQKRLETLGENNPACVICGEDNPFCLEKHHIAGQAYGDDLCTVCRNCHRKLSDDQKDHPKQISETPSALEAMGHLLIGLADFFTLLVIKLKECGQFLIQTAQAMAGAV